MKIFGLNILTDKGLNDIKAATRQEQRSLSNSIVSKLLRNAEAARQLALKFTDSRDLRLKTKLFNDLKGIGVTDADIAEVSSSRYSRDAGRQLLPHAAG